MTEAGLITVKQKLDALRRQVEAALAEAQNLYSAYSDIGTTADFTRIAAATAKFSTGSTIGVVALLVQLEDPGRKELFDFEETVKRTGGVPANKKAEKKGKGKKAS